MLKPFQYNLIEIVQANRSPVIAPYPYDTVHTPQFEFITNPLKPCVRFGCKKRVMRVSCAIARLNERCGTTVSYFFGVFHCVEHTVAYFVYVNITTSIKIKILTCTFERLGWLPICRWFWVHDGV